MTWGNILNVHTNTEIDEDGVAAAVVTVAGVGTAVGVSGRVDFNVNRPFSIILRTSGPTLSLSWASSTISDEPLTVY